LIASPTIWGARNIPWKRARISSPGVDPHSTPKPGADRRAAAASTQVFLPAIYPPQGAIVPPGFFIRLPAIKSAPWKEIPMLCDALQSR